MEILRFFLRSSGRMTLFVSAFSVVSGVFNAGMVALVHQILVHGATSGLTLAFLGVAVGRVVTGYFSSVALTKHAYESVTELRKELIEKFLAVPYAHFEKLGRERVFAALTEDVNAANMALQSLPTFLVNVAMVCGGSAYLIYLSGPTFVAVGFLFACGTLAYRVVSKSARPYMVRARDEHDQLFGHFRALTEGTKELKQHAGRRRAFLERSVLETSERLRQLRVTGQSRYQLGQAVSSTVTLLALALILFVMPHASQLSAATISGYVLTCLYLMAPLSGAVRVLPMFANAEIALRRIGELGVSLGDAAREWPSDIHPETFASVELRDVVHSYEGERGEPRFRLGPLSLELRPGEVVFITGQNGSGKSTLAKILVGLYAPESGSVLRDGVVVDDAARDEYRQLFSVIFADYYLFESLLGLDGQRPGALPAPPATHDERARHALSRLALEGHVTIQGGRLSTTRLSHGQRKRLSLLTAYLEDRPIYVFDEWASDQDPQFKDVFYRELVPELKARGKAVVVITHDDRYFGLADRRIALAQGQLAAG
jgi:putative ATP-binding cassette transporter